MKKLLFMSWVMFLVWFIVFYMMFITHDIPITARNQLTSFIPLLLF